MKMVMMTKMMTGLRKKVKIMSMVKKVIMVLTMNMQMEKIMNTTMMKTALWMKNTQLTMKGTVMFPNN